MMKELRTKEILNKSRTNVFLKQKQILLSFLVIIILGVICLWGVGGYMGILKEATTIVLKPPTIKAMRYMYIVLHLDKYVQSIDTCKWHFGVILM